MKKFIYLFTMAAVIYSCSIEKVNDPNNPSVSGVISDASKAELQAVVTGLEARHRGYFTNATQMFGCFGREVWAYFGSDPRFVADWLGQGITETYPDFFASAGTYTTPYLAVRQANILIDAADNSSALTTQEANAYKGFAKTIKAFQLMWPWLQQWNNGIRVDVAEPLNPGPTLERAAALAEIRAIIDDGYSDLQAAGSSLPFELTTGWAGFDNPAGLLQINRAIAARLAIYAEDWQGAVNALGESFLDLNANNAATMNAGPAFVYGNAPDINNPLYYPYDRSTSTILICHPAWVEDGEAGDLRLNKVIRRVDNPVTNPGLRDANDELLIGEYQDARWETNLSSIPFMRNEELILIYAEANAHLNKPDEAVRAINIVRNTWGLADYTGGTSLDELIDAILHERRYSLWAEGGHRWVDLRRYNKLNSTYVDLRDQGNLFTQVSRRTSEINWDEQ